MKYIFLSLSIMLEVTRTTALKYSKGFNDFFPSLIDSFSYILCLYFISLMLKMTPQEFLMRSGEVWGLF
ncbi:SMR family transporter [Bacteroidetes bacterium endosymbiont of Geopemphigus sp.]|uniref:SMR family transporter n=1 Tax=Bacteroidetes bacterium endosymbiont of Geopemphigus sp. TaxID=2047937 RepID=UPI000CD2F75D